jgi:hypothetical protein
VKLSLLNVQLDHFLRPVRLVGRELVDVGVPIQRGDKSLNASNAPTRTDLMSVRLIIHLAIQLLTSEMMMGSTKIRNMEPHSGFAWTNDRLISRLYARMLTGGSGATSRAVSATVLA